MRAWGESSALECMWIYAAYELRSRIAAFDGPMIGGPRLFAKRCAILFRRPRDRSGTDLPARALVQTAGSGPL
jgi:hypothetical protein